MTQAHIARRWGISKQAVQTMVAKGMPMDSIEAAEAWRAARPRAKQTARKKSASASKPPAADPATLAAKLEAEGVDSWAGLDTSQRLHQHQRQLHERLSFARRMAEAWQSADPELSRKWLTLEAQLAARAPAIEKAIQETLEREKVTITTEDAQREFCGFLMRIRGHLERAPAALAGKCNPSDPEHARQQIEQWIEGVFKSLHSAPSVTK